MTWTIGSKLKASFGAVVALTLISGAATFVLLKSAESGLVETVDHDLPAAHLTTQFEREILNARIHYIYHVTIQKPGAVATGDKRFEGAREVLGKMSRHYQRIGVSTEKVGALEKDFRDYETALRQILKAVDSGMRSGPEYNATVANWARLGGRLVDGAGALNAAATAETQTAIDNSVGQMGQTVTIAGVLSAFVVLAGFILAAWMVRSIRGFLTESAGEIAAAISYMGAASAQVADASRRVAQMATEQSGSIAIAAEASQQVAGGAEGNRRDSEEMATAADSGRRATETGNRLLADMVAAMREIGESSSKVSKVIRVIDEIAFQTNILALNAAVEAARAGESGRGFAVVADEVRTLAQRSAQAARETAVLIEESVQRSDRGGRQVEQLSGALGELVGVSDSLGRLAVAVREGSRNQAEGIGQVSSAVAALEQTTQDNAATAEECASAATELAGQAEAMNSIASRLKDYVGAR